jgi:hypothetical protein
MGDDSVMLIRLFLSTITNSRCSVIVHLQETRESSMGSQAKERVFSNLLHDRRELEGKASETLFEQ